MKSLKSFEEACGIFTLRKGRHIRAAKLSELYSSLGESSTDLDNMLYDQFGMSCEDILNLLRRGVMKIN